VAATDEYAPTFALIDTDQDGYISLAEFTRLMELLGGDRATEETVEGMFSRIDANGDGKVDLAELSSFLEATAR
jgi:Ca2+-binding EF-hand superfamily protein